MKTSVVTIGQSGKCIQGCYSVFSFLRNPLPSNLMHFLCREPLNLKTGERERSFPEKHRGNNKHKICNHLSGEMVIYLGKNVYDIILRLVVREMEHIPLRANMWQSELLHLQIVFCRWNYPQHSARGRAEQEPRICIPVPAVLAQNIWQEKSRKICNSLN